MSDGARWWARVTAAVMGAMLTLVVPVHAWAATNGVADVAIEAARVRRRGGIGLFGILGGLCCLVVILAVVFSLMTIMKRRRR